MYSLLLERIIANEAVEGDQSLTKKTCRETLKNALGLSTLDPDLDFINKEITRIASLCVEYTEKDADAVRVMAEQPVPSNVKEQFLSLPPTSAEAPATVTAAKPSQLTMAGKAAMAATPTPQPEWKETGVNHWTKRKAAPAPLSQVRARARPRTVIAEHPVPA